MDNALVHITELKHNCNNHYKMNIKMHEKNLGSPGLGLLGSAKRTVNGRSHPYDAKMRSKVTDFETGPKTEHH